MKNTTKILICDENAEERAKLSQSLIKAGFAKCDEASDGESAYEMIRKNCYDIVVTDLWISGLDGIGMIRTVKKLAMKDEPSFILMSPSTSNRFS